MTMALSAISTTAGAEVDGVDGGSKEADGQMPRSLVSIATRRR
ncbi:hypothetical protein [Alloactinosynnema sp. L-07]|nr:hypothetical protein [Alloactinosynnema sp. L-07]